MHASSLVAVPPRTLPGPRRTPTTPAEWAEDLRRRWDLHVVGTPSLVPVRLVATTHGAVVEFTGVGTSLRLRVHDSAALRTVALTSDCDCGVPHPDPYGAAPDRKTILDPASPPRREVVRDGAVLYGWSGITAARLPLPVAASHLESMLSTL